MMTMMMMMERDDQGGGDIEVVKVEMEREEMTREEVGDEVWEEVEIKYGVDLLELELEDFLWFMAEVGEMVAKM